MLFDITVAMAIRYLFGKIGKGTGFVPDVGFLLCSRTSFKQAIWISVWSWLVGVVEAPSPEGAGW